MNNAVDIVFVLEKKYPDPNVTIRAKEKTRLVDNIIQAVENVSEKSFLSIPAYEGDEIKLLSQRDILRARSHEHKVIVQTETDSFLVKKTLIALEEMLDPERFLRISHSEIINLYKVKSFDLNIKGASQMNLDSLAYAVLKDYQDYYMIHKESKFPSANMMAKDAFYRFISDHYSEL